MKFSSCDIKQIEKNKQFNRYYLIQKLLKVLFQNLIKKTKYKSSLMCGNVGGVTRFIHKGAFNRYVCGDLVWNRNFQPATTKTGINSPTFTQHYTKEKYDNYLHAYT